MPNFLETAMRPWAARFGLESPSRATSRASHLYAKMPLPQLVAQVEDIANIGFWRLELPKGTVAWSPGVFAIHDLPVADEVDLDNALAFYPPHHRPVIEAAVKKVVADGTSYDLELDFISAKGNLKRVRAMGHAELSGGKVAAIVGVLQDITPRYLAREKLRSANLRDELTGLPNQRHMEQFFKDLGLEDARRQCEPVALVLINLSLLDRIGIQYGPQAQNTVLLTVADRLRQAWPVPSFPARIGIDDFALLLRNPGDFAKASHLAKNVCRTLLQPINIDGESVEISASIGISLRDSGSLPFTSLLSDAELAARRAKQHPSGVCVISHGSEHIPLNCG